MVKSMGSRQRFLKDCLSIKGLRNCTFVLELVDFLPGFFFPFLAAVADAVVLCAECLVDFRPPALWWRGPEAEVLYCWGDL